MKIAFARCLALVAVSALTLGCKPPKPAPAPPHVHAEHDHEEIGPHKGHIIELGNEEYHAELTHDDATKTVTIYLLDSKAEKAVPIKATDLTLNLVTDGKPQQVKLAAAPQAGDPEGEASAFAIVDEAVVEALESEKTTARFSVEIAGKTYSGKIEHHEHDHPH